LFVVSQLAKRHGIRVTLKASPYGGTAAIVLIPQHLVVTEEAFRAGLPGEPAAIGVAAQAINGNHAPAKIIGLPEGDRRGAHHAAPSPGLEPLAGPGRDETAATEPAYGAGEHPDFDVFTPGGRDPGTGDAAIPAEAGSAGAPQAGAEAAAYVSSPPYPVTAPYPGAGTTPYADQPTPFPGWTGRSVAGGSVTPSAPTAAGPGVVAGPGAGARPGAAAGPGAQAGPSTPMTPVASPRPARSSAGPPWELSRQTGPLPAIPADGEPGAQPGGDGDVKGLPRRVRQASIAPQLRDNPPSRRTSAAPAPAPAPASGPTPAEIRQTMSALQRGWQEGRSQRMTASAADDSPFGPPGQGASPEGDRGPAADELPGESDGT
jgi:hypothetical protein